MESILLPPLLIENVKPLLQKQKVFEVDMDEDYKINSLFVALNKQVPSQIKIEMDRASMDYITSRILSTYSIPRENITTICDFDCREQKDLIIFLNRQLYIEIELEFFSTITIIYPYSHYSEFIRGITAIAKKLSTAKKNVEDNFYLILSQNTSSGQDLKVKQFQLKPFKISIEDNYNDDFIPVHNRITKRLNTFSDKGVVLLHGAPGTGKTTYIRYLARTINKKIIYIPPQFSRDLTSSQFVELMLKHTNSVLIIEDAENIIEDRNFGRNLSISGLLNIADGLLSFCLKLQIICTFNTDLSRIDPALMRKGRLIALYEFRELETEKAKRLASSLDLEIPVTGPMTLAEIYNHADHAMGYMPLTIMGFKKK